MLKMLLCCQTPARSTPFLPLLVQIGVLNLDPCAGPVARGVQEGASSTVRMLPQGPEDIAARRSSTP
jgi:hypothetical protein